ncbi:MAG: hypothetical protein IT267_10375 [Saprospiraceae bacterium]|nr:hypothetical protein [Saprospiraceae bacterium]
MIQFINRYFKIPSLKPESTKAEAIRFFEKYNLDHLHIVQSDIYLGTLNKNQIESLEEGEKLSLLKDHSVQSSIHPLDNSNSIWEKFIRLKLSHIAVTNEEIFLGSICFDDFVSEQEKENNIKSDGSWIAISMKKQNYSLSQLSSITEENHCSIQFLFLIEREELEDLIVTMRLNCINPESVSTSLLRFPLDIIMIHSKKQHLEPLKERYDELMHYLNV